MVQIKYNLRASHIIARKHNKYIMTLWTILLVDITQNIYFLALSLKVIYSNFLKLLKRPTIISLADKGTISIFWLIANSPLSITFYLSSQKN